MGGRLKTWFWEWLIALDQLVGTWFFGWTYVWLGGGRPCPRADETISSVVGKASRRGLAWGHKWERRINWLLGADHCRLSIEDDEGQLPNLSQTASIDYTLRS